MLRKLLIITFTAAALACSASPKLKKQKMVDGIQNIEPDEQQRLVCREVMTLIENYNYKKVKFGDSLSSVTFDRYIKQLDPSRMFFSAADMKEFEQYRTTLNDDIRNGDLSGPFFIFNTYLKRANEYVDYGLKRLKAKFNFTSNDTYVRDRKGLPWVSNTTALNNLWDKNIKYDLLKLTVANPSSETKNVQTLTKTYQTLKNNLAEYNNQDVFQIFMEAFTESVDPHTNYFNPIRAADFNTSMSRSFEGIGATLSTEDHVIKIVSLIAGGPAFKSKELKAGDRIVGVAEGTNGEFIDLTGWRLDNAITKIKGPKGTIVRLKIIPVGKELSSKPNIVNLTREKIILEDQSAKKTIKSVTEDGKTYKIGVITVPAFYADFKSANEGDKNYKSTTRDVKLLIDTLKNIDKVDAIVMDLRDNGGGSLMEAISLTGLFIDKGPVVQVKDSRSVEVQNDRDLGMSWTGPLGVMVNRTSASASEIFSAAIQDYGRGIIMGSQTYGKGTVQSTIDLNNMINPSALDKLIGMIKTGDKEAKPKATLAAGKKPITITDKDGKPLLGQLNLTISKFYRINGSSTQHKGVTPDIVFPSLYPLDKIGEDTEPSALPFDMINAANYQPVANITSIKPELEKLHEQRMEKSVYFKLIGDGIAEEKKEDKDTSVTLNEKKYKAWVAEQEAKNLVKTNELRAAKGLAPLKKGDKSPKDDDTDVIQGESLKVMADFIRLTQANNITFDQVKKP